MRRYLGDAITREGLIWRVDKKCGSRLCPRYRLHVVNLRLIATPDALHELRGGAAPIVVDELLARSGAR